MSSSASGVDGATDCYNSASSNYDDDDGDGDDDKQLTLFIVYCLHYLCG